MHQAAQVAVSPLGMTIVCGCGVEQHLFSPEVFYWLIMQVLFRLHNV